MSGIDLSRPSHGELESTLIRFIGFLKAQSYIGVPGKKVSVKIFRNIYNQKFKYALTNVSFFICFFSFWSDFLIYNHVIENFVLLTCGKTVGFFELNLTNKKNVPIKSIRQ